MSNYKYILKENIVYWPRGQATQPERTEKKTKYNSTTDISPLLSWLRSNNLVHYYIWHYYDNSFETKLYLYFSNTSYILDRYHLLEANLLRYLLYVGFI